MEIGELAQEILKRMAAVNRYIGKKTLREFWKGEAYVLTYLHESDGASPGDISAAMGVSTARIAAALNALEKKGLISRERNPLDQRRIEVRLTDEGSRHIRGQMEKLREEMEILLRSLGEEDAQAYLRIMDRIAQSVGRENIEEAYHVRKQNSED